MGKNKLKKFAEMLEIPFVLQYPWGVLQQSGGFPHRGCWDSFFGNSNPITLELGCGKGEYTVGLAARYKNRNFVGIDVKGARMWTGAKEALADGLENVAFLRTDIELLPHFFAPGEVETLWITFPDPQMQKPRKRLTGTRMLEIYKQVLGKNGRINLKTDSPFLYAYTKMVCVANALPVYADVSDIYNLPPTVSETEVTNALPPEVTAMQTHYEKQWIDRGLTIKFLSFGLDTSQPLVEPEGAEDIPRDTYRSYSRGQLGL